MKIEICKHDKFNFAQLFLMKEFLTAFNFRNSVIEVFNDVESSERIGIELDKLGINYGLICGFFYLEKDNKFILKITDEEGEGCNDDDDDDDDVQNEFIAMYGNG